MSTLTATPVSPERTGVPDTGTPWRATRHLQTLFDGAGGGQTLDDVVSGAWEELTAHAIVDCPLCGGELTPEYGSAAHARPIGGRCRRCGTRLS